MMQIIEDTPERLVYHEVFELKNNVWAMLTIDDVPRLFLLTFVTITVLLALLPHPSNVWNIIVSGIVIGGYICAVWWIQRDVVGRQLVESFVIVDKRNGSISNKSCYRRGKDVHFHVPRAEILCLEPNIHSYLSPSDPHRYGISVSVKTNNGIQFRYSFAGFDNPEARDAMLTQLQAVLNLPVQAPPEN